jgi:hypothetical protein
MGTNEKGNTLLADKRAFVGDVGGLICVLSGETTRANLEAYRSSAPAVVVETLGDLA